MEDSGNIPNRPQTQNFPGRKNIIELMDVSDFWLDGDNDDDGEDWGIEN